MLAVPIDKLLQRMDEIEIEYSEYVNRWRALRAMLEEEAATKRINIMAKPNKALGGFALNRKGPK